MQWKDKKVMVYGAARSGISAAALLQKQEASVLLFDSDTKLSADTLKDRLSSNNHIQFITGNMKEEILLDTQLVIISPGVPLNHPDIIMIKERNIPIWGEVELAYRFTKGKIVGITGTNGKTTTTALIGEIMKAYYKEVYVVGNIGKSYSDSAIDTTTQSVTIVELSSFQLETIESFRPDISIILNITPDHLDRHITMDNYIAMKERITANQTKTDLCILNYEDEILRSMAKRINSELVFFSSERELKEGIYLAGEEIILKREGVISPVCNINDLKLLGKHNYENVMAAVCASLRMRIPMEYIKKALTNFRAVEHRIEFVETINGVDYYNDSKGTNPDASIRAIQAMRHPTILIAGGYDKKIPFDNLIEAMKGKVRYLILLGQTKEMFAETAKAHGFTDIILTDSLLEAVEVSVRIATPGDAVLLSPACASWGQFENYEQRGRLFKEYVREKLKKE